jgi:hypothetical protein
LEPRKKVGSHKIIWRFLGNEMATRQERAILHSYNAGTRSWAKVSTNIGIEEKPFAEGDYLIQSSQLTTPLCFSSIFLPFGLSHGLLYE